MTTISDLPMVLVEEILSRVQLRSLRSVRFTCKTWHSLSKTMILGKTRNEFLGLMVKDSRVYSMRYDLQGFHNKEDVIDPSIKQVPILNHSISKIFHYDGLVIVLYVIKDKECRVILWNPYLGQTRWIPPRDKSHKFHTVDMFALGYEKNNHNHNYKILRFFHIFKYHVFFEMYDLNSRAWRVLDVDPNCDIKSSLSLKGNTYFLARKNPYGLPPLNIEVRLVCFDFTAERFGPHLVLPFEYCANLEDVTLSCVREEHLAVSKQCGSVMEIWITTEIEPNAVSWSIFLKVELPTFADRYGSIFIDEKKKQVTMVFDYLISKKTKTSWFHRAYIIREGGYLKSVKFEEILNLWDPYGSENCNPLLFSSYVPSLVKLQINKRRGKRKKSHEYY